MTRYSIQFEIPLLLRYIRAGMKTFKTPMAVHFDDTDAAGICFFGNVFKKVHQAYEEFLQHLEIDARNWFLHNEQIVPIRHIESDFLKPLLPFQDYEIEIWASKISQHSFQLSYEILKQGQSCGLTKMTHIFCSKDGKEKQPLPPAFREKLLPYLKDSTV